MMAHQMQYQRIVSFLQRRIINMSTKLPDKPSELLMLALRDLEITEKDPRYIIEMSTWYELNYNGKCMVCLAGCVVAQELKPEPRSFTIFPEAFDDDTAKKLRLIDTLRVGVLLIRDDKSFYSDLDYFHSGQREQSEYGDPDWWNHMCAIVGILQAEGL